MRCRYSDGSNTGYLSGQKNNRPILLGIAFNFAYRGSWFVGLVVF
jgi:hypothetical protein